MSPNPQETADLVTVTEEKYKCQIFLIPKFGVNQVCGSNDRFDEPRKSLFLPEVRFTMRK